MLNALIHSRKSLLKILSKFLFLLLRCSSFLSVLFLAPVELNHDDPAGHQEQKCFAHETDSARKRFLIW